MVNDDKPKLPKRLYYRLSEAAEYLTKNGMECNETDLLHFGVIGQCAFIFKVPENYTAYVDAHFDFVDEYVEMINYRFINRTKIHFLKLHAYCLFEIETSGSITLDSYESHVAYRLDFGRETFLIEARENFEAALTVLTIPETPPWLDTPRNPFEPYDNADIGYCLRGDGYESNSWSADIDPEVNKANGPQITIEDVYITASEVERLFRGDKLTEIERAEMIAEPLNDLIENEVFERGIVLWGEGEKKGYGALIDTVAKKIVSEFAAETPPRLNKRNSPFTVGHITRMLSGLQTEYCRRNPVQDKKTLG